MRIRRFQTTAALVALVALVAAARAQTPVVSNVAGLSGTGDPAEQTAQPRTVADCIKEIKHPTDWLNWGGDFRVRNEYYPNTVSLSKDAPLNEQDVVRYRGRLWASLTPLTNLSFNGRVAAEPRLWVKPAFTASDVGNSGMEWRYGIVDTLNVKWSNIFDQPISLTAGRQDIMLGDYYDWWLVVDGTPDDGSWTLFLDSIRATAEAKGIQTKFDLIYIQQNAQPDEWMPTIGSTSFVHPDLNARTDYQLTEQNEQGVVAYVSNSSIDKTKIDGYFIYKRDNRQRFERLGVTTPMGDNANIYTLGGKITGTPMENWQYSAEGAYQFGTKEDNVREDDVLTFAQRDIDAYGGKAKLTYLFNDKYNCQLSLNGEFLSGDNPKTTGKDEMFDLLWGRWPRWSELYIYSYATETSGKFAQMNNLIRFGPSWTCNPTKGLTASVTYNALFAPEDTPTRTPSAGADAEFSKDGRFRGHYLQAVLKHQFNKNVSAHLWGEWIWEGDYYSHRDVLSFLRAEVMFSF
ncbi:MAG TPA: alginate export family protein [Verrucomicrobiae bacterium]|nr:alginate export family protein [Verrucomicrobiae bacterium]